MSAPETSHTSEPQMQASDMMEAQGDLEGGPTSSAARASAPEPLIYAMDLVVRDDDIDVLGHASNIVFVRWIQDVAVAHSTAVGLGIEGYKKLGAVFVVVRHEIDYLRPAMRGEVIEGRTWISAVMAAKCLRRTDLVRKSDGVVLAKGLTTWGFVAIDNGRPKRITPGVVEAFGPYVHP